MGAENQIVAKFRETLRQLMEERGVSAAAVAEATNVPKSTLSERLSGRQPKLDDSIVRLARFFGVSVERLITGREPEASILEDILEQADKGFVEIHRGTYRVRVEKFIGKGKK